MIKKIGTLDLDIKIPTSPSYWRGVALTAAKEIRRRTEGKGLDSDERPFKPYAPSYRAYRVEHGRSARPNLSYTGKMVGSLGTGARGHKDKASILIGGEQGFKAVQNEQRGRRFFDVSDRQADRIAGEVLDWIAKANGLK